MQRDAFTLWLSLLACGVGPSCAADSSRPSEQPSPESGAGIRALCAGTAMTTALDWGVATDVESPAAVFGVLEGRCDAEFEWGAEAAVPIPQTRVNVGVELDHASARKVHPGGNGGTEVCRTFLEVDAMIDLRTADGLLQVSGAMTQIRASGPRPQIDFAQMSSEQPGLAIALAREEQATLSYRLTGVGSVCTGGISLSRQVTRGNESSGTAGRVGSFARWSN